MTAPLRQSEPIVVPVALGARAYDIVIGRGLLASLGTRIKALRPGARVALVTDEAVARHHLPAAEGALKAAGIDTARIVVPVGEGSKSYATFETVCEAIIAARIERNEPMAPITGPPAICPKASSWLLIESTVARTRASIVWVSHAI